MAVLWSTKWRWDTTFSADSVEWCPVEPYTEVLVCGTYQLQESDESQSAKQNRLGRVYLFRINAETEALKPIQTIEISGILDQKWCYHELEDHPVLAIVTSRGSLQLYKLISEAETIELKLWMEEMVLTDGLALSVDWSTNKSRSEDPLVIVSDSIGRCSLYRVQDKLNKVGEWNAHGFEAWIGAFNYWNHNVFYSGGDDCLFKSFDLRAPDAVAVNRSHDAGVTAIRSHTDKEHVLITGSYDEKIRLWDDRNLKRCAADLSVNGGVWRLKWHPHRPDTVLAACMYGGFRLVDTKNDLRVVCEYMEHESIAYGADWKWGVGEECVVATCSFYDCKLHVGDVQFG